MERYLNIDIPVVHADLVQVLNRMEVRLGIHGHLIVEVQEQVRTLQGVQYKLEDQENDSSHNNVWNCMSLCKTFSTLFLAGLFLRL